MTTAPATADTQRRRVHPAWWAAGATFLALLGAALATGYFFVGFRARQHLSLNAYTFDVARYAA